MFALLQSTSLFAQQSTSLTDDRIRVIIVALLVVAALLAVSTIWFFFHTSPRRRGGTAVAATPGAYSAVPGTTADRVGMSATATANPGATAPSAAAAPVTTSDQDDDDEWLRLTSPEKRTAPTADPGRPPAQELPRTNG